MGTNTRALKGWCICHIQVQYRTSQIIYAEFFEQVNNKIITIYIRAQHEGQDLMIHR